MKSEFPPPKAKAVSLIAEGNGFFGLVRYI